MRRRLPLSCLVAASIVVASIALTAAGPAAAAKSTRTEPASSLLLVEAPRSHHWRILISGVVGKQFPKRNVTISEQGPKGGNVSYQVHGHANPDGSIAAKFPGVGRVDLDFETTKTEKISFEGEGCPDEGNATLRRGFFRGTIELHGEGGLPSLERRGSPGQIIETPAVTCPAKKHPSGSGEDEEGNLGESGSQGRTDSLRVGSKLKGGLFSFEASVEPQFLPSLPAEAIFIASWSRLAHGMQTNVDDYRIAPAKDLAFSPLKGPPTEATVEPPAPFRGSAVFKLESPTVASWSGDLEVDLPLLGAVPLTGPGTWSTLCRGATCTDTLPPGVQVISKRSSPRTFAPTSGLHENARRVAPDG